MSLKLPLQIVYGTFTLRTIYFPRLTLLERSNHLDAGIVDRVISIFILKPRQHRLQYSDELPWTAVGMLSWGRRGSCIGGTISTMFERRVDKRWSLLYLSEYIALRAFSEI